MAKMGRKRVSSGKFLQVKGAHRRNYFAQSTKTLDEMIAELKPHYGGVVSDVLRSAVFELYRRVFKSKAALADRAERQLREDLQPRHPRSKGYRGGKV